MSNQEEDPQDFVDLDLAWDRHIQTHRRGIDFDENENARNRVTEIEVVRRKLASGAHGNLTGQR